MTLRIGMIAGEPSGDQLGAELIRDLRTLHADVEVSGIAGPAMREAGCTALASSDELAVMGLVEVLKHYPRLLGLQRRITQIFLDDPPDLVIGIDAPDFNLTVEERCRSAGIATAHYVSPTVWAWRENRIKKIARAADLVLTIFPFEEAYFRERGVPAVFVGHPMADAIPDESDRQAARERLAIASGVPVLAVLPGSRSSELRRHVDTFLATAELCQREFQNLQCVIPVVNAAGEANIRAALAKRLARDAQACLAAPLICRHGVADALRAADAVLTASGTAAVETMLYKRPMVVAYRVARMTYWMLRRMLKVPYISMPNILAGRMLVPEFIQGAMVAERMAPQLIEWLHEPSTAQPMLEEFQRIHQSLRRGSGQSSAHAVLSLVRN